MHTTTIRAKRSLLATTLAALAMACAAPAAFAQTEGSSGGQPSSPPQTMQTDTSTGMQADDAAMNAPKPKKPTIRANDTSANAIADKDAEQAKDRAREQGTDDQPEEEEESSSP